MNPEWKNREQMYKEPVDGRPGRPPRAPTVARYSPVAVLAGWSPKHLVGRPRVLGVLLFAVLAVLLTPAVGAGAEVASPPEPSSASVWYADGAAMVQVNPETGKAARTVNLPRGLDSISALAVDPTDGSAVVLSEGRLLGFDASGEKTFEGNLRDASALGETPVLASDPKDGSLWVGGKGLLVRTDDKGKYQRSVKLEGDEVVRAVHPAQEDGSAWVLSTSRLLHLAEDGEVLNELAMPEEGVASPKRLAVDEVEGYAYVAGAEEVAWLALDEAEGEARGEPPRKIAPEGGVESLAYDPSGDTLYTVSRSSLSAYDGGSGERQNAVDLSPYGAGGIRAVSFDAPSGTVWVRGEDKLLGFSGDLDETRADIEAGKQGAGPSVLAAKAPKLSLRLSLLEPQNGATLKDAKQPVKLKIVALCNTKQCPAKQARQAAKKLRLNATLDGRKVGHLFVKTGSLAARDGITMTYVPGGEGLPEGAHALSAYASVSEKVRSNKVRARFVVDTTAPRFSNVMPENGSMIPEEQATITGSVDDPEARVYLEKLQDLGGKVISANPDGFSFEVPLEEGDNSFRLLAYDEAGNMGQYSLQLVHEAPLVLTVTEPEQNSTITTPSNEIDVKGTVEGPEGTTVKAGQIDASIGEGGSFVAQDVPLVRGHNSISVKATTPGGRSVQRMLELEYDPDPPDTEPPPDPSEPDVRVERPPDSPVPTPGPLPDDPQEIAPDVDPGVPTDTFDSTRFLYEGENAIQTGVEEGAIEEERVAVLKGKVLDRTGEPVPGVRITVLDRPELGQTLTREDGQFDIVVNGGGLVTLSYEKDRYMPAQRQIEAPWRDFAVMDDVVLAGFSRRVTDVDLDASDQMQVARGSATTDEDGTRQATVLLPGDTEAEMVMPDGSTQALNEMDFRATEYTVGADGPETMPGALPAPSGYTYAVELSVDEAVEVGASEVRFSEPLYNYVENYLGFPVGSDVPNGYYDREKGQWVPSDDGVVIKILSVNNGLADLDVDGSGTAASAAALEALGITNEERAKLAGLYEAGQSLWRVPIAHFTPWDHNFPYGPPEDAESPEQPPRPDNTPEPEPECQAGSVIECQNQILGENLGISGAPFSLHYGSDGAPGRTASRTLDISLSGASVPSSLKRIELEVLVAGQEFKRSFPAEPNQSYTYTWDGKDAYGRTVTGEQDVSYRIGYAYRLEYKATPADLVRSFGRIAGASFSVVRPSQEVTLWQEGEGRVASWDDRAHGIGGWTPDVLHQYDPEGGSLRFGNGDRRSNKDLAKVITTAAGNGECCGSSGDGGPATEAKMGAPRGVAVAPDGSFYVADTSNHRVRRVGADGTITTVAGTGAQGNTGDGGPATEARLSYPEGVAVAPDGSLYIADTVNNRVRRVGTDGIITTVAGVYDQGYSGDGGPATQARLNRPSGVAVAPDGSFYVADSHNHRVRRVGADGTITTIAGTGTRGYSGDGGPATSAELNLLFVNHPVVVGSTGLVVAPDGSLYISDIGNNVVRRVGADGTITTVAGTGARGYSGDGGPATEARLNLPDGLAVAPNGSLYVADHDNNRVRRVGADGTITTIAGTGVYGYSGDDGPAGDARLRFPSGLAVAPNGYLYVADQHNLRVRRVAMQMFGAGPDDAVIASEDGAELYHFDGEGKHLRTLDALTGTVLYTFSYDGKGRLISIEDVDGLTTTVERDAASGDATAIVAPNGDRTELTLDEGGYLESFSNPAGETHSFTYHGGGLLRSLTDPRNNTTSFTYDERGRLKKDEDPAGGYKELSRANTARGYSVVLETAMGREHDYEVEELPGGDSLRTNTDPSGLETRKTINPDGDLRETSPDGTVVETATGPDPRFGMQSPVTESATIKTPNGLTFTASVDKEATLANPGDPLSLQGITNTTTVNGKVWTSEYEAATNNVTTTSPEGRQIITTVDEKGRVVLEDAEGFAPASYSYDERGRIEQATFGEGLEARTATYAYDSKDRIRSITDPENRTTTFDEYDEAGRVKKQTLPGGRVILYSYDDNGNLTSVTPPGKPEHEFGHTERNQTSSYDAPQVGTEQPTTTYEYDLDKQLRSINRPGGDKVAFIYDDPSGRLQTVRYPEGEKTYSYDPNTGNLATVRSAGGETLTYTFDGFLPTSETASGRVPGKVQYRYDNNLRVVGVKVNSGAEVTYAYDDDGLIENAGSLDLVRDPARGLVTGSTLSGATDEVSYNDFGEQDSYEASFGSTELYSVTYDERDSLGRITQKTETIGGESTTYAYTYDEAGRLEEVKQDGSVVATYAYDANGNRLSRTTPGGTTEGDYDDQDRLTSYGDNEYAYDPDGQLKSKTDTVTGEVTHYSYDSLGNLLSARLPDGKEIEYVIDARDRRVGKKVDGVLTQGFLYQGKVAPVAELDGSGNVVSRFVYATRSNVPDYMEKGGKTYRLITDNLGSVRLVVDAADGTVAQRLDYDEFGNVLNDTNPGFQPFGFAGGLYDPDTGLTRFGVRDYDAETGRWTAKDPIGFAGGSANLYGYVFDDPINLKDPLGLYGLSDAKDDLNALGNWFKDTLYTYPKDHWFGKDRDPKVDKVADAATDWALEKSTGGWSEKLSGLLEKAKAVCGLAENLQSESSFETSGKDGLRMLRDMLTIGGDQLPGGYGETTGAALDAMENQANNYFEGEGVSPHGPQEPPKGLRSRLEFYGIK